MEHGSQPASLKSALNPHIRMLDNYPLILVLLNCYKLFLKKKKKKLLKKPLHGQPRNGISFSVSPFTPRQALHRVHLHFDKMSLSEKLSQRDVCLRPVLGNVIRNKYIYWVSQKVIEVFP